MAYRRPRALQDFSGVLRCLTLLRRGRRAGGLGGGKPPAPGGTQGHRWNLVDGYMTTRFDRRFGTRAVSSMNVPDRI